MSSAFKCDWCGKLYEPYNKDGAEDSMSLRGTKIVRIAWSANNGYLREQEEYDICPDCFVEFYKLIETKGGRYVTEESDSLADIFD